MLGAVSPNTFDHILSTLRLSRQDLLQRSLSRDYPLLHGNFKIWCLQGKIRALAARLAFGETAWWTVKLITDVAGPDCIRALRLDSEQFSHETSYSDGAIYRKVRYYMAGNQLGQARRWILRLSSCKRKSLYALLRDKVVHQALDELLPYTGLWDGLQLGNMHKHLALRCPMQMVSFLRHIRDTYNEIFRGVEQCKDLLDVDTVRFLQYKCPSASTDDRSLIQDAVRRHEIFILISDSEVRSTVLANILALQVVIPSIQSFHKNMIYFSIGAKIVRHHIEPTKSHSNKTRKPSLFESLRTDWEVPPECSIRTGKDEYQSLSRPLTPELAFALLILDALLDFPRLCDESPVQDRQGERMAAFVDEQYVARFRRGAIALGFHNAKVSQGNSNLAMRDSDITDYTGLTSKASSSDVWRGGKPPISAFRELQRCSFLPILYQAHNMSTTPSVSFIQNDFIRSFFGVFDVQHDGDVEMNIPQFTFRVPWKPKVQRFETLAEASADVEMELTPAEASSDVEMELTPVLTEGRETVDTHTKNIANVQTREARRSIQGLFGGLLGTPATRLGKRKWHDFETADTSVDTRPRTRDFKRARFLENRLAAIREEQPPQAPSSLNSLDTAGRGVRGEAVRSIQVLPKVQKDSSVSNPVQQSSKRVSQLFEPSLRESLAEGQEIQKQGDVSISKEHPLPVDAASATTVQKDSSVSNLVQQSSKRAGRLFELSLRESLAEGQEIQKQGDVSVSEEHPLPADAASAMPASEASLFIGVLGLKSHPEIEGTIDRYTNIFRDMPEMLSWMRLMASKGHRVWLAGGGLAVLRSRIRSPLRYWREGNGNNTIRLWVMVKASAADEELAQRRHSKPSAYYALTEDGDVVWSRTPQMRALRGTGKFMYGNVLPLPGTFCDDDPYPSGTGWLKSNLGNSNKIEFVCNFGVDEELLLSHRTPTRVPIYDICPIAHDKSHLSRRCCATLGPGAMWLRSVYASGRKSEVFTLPYIDVTHSIAMESSREPKLPQHRLHTSLWSDDFETIYKGGDLAGVFLEKKGQFAVKIRCCDYEGNICREYQVASSCSVLGS
ncbi:hypothetical protein NPX13_g2476 [Xylaria arbuscula]|uniref:Uncharacterized protein n=1 Tax=Xylaria arbuscula TaxID=114810 RepID=A0A9W8TNQ1_9PEZI|nr:hypothetical protein NPX13_g2476 [Xylaria arbuscula]